MGKRAKVADFLKSYDRYSKNVSLTYKKKGSYATSIGGCCTIFSFTVLSYWLGVNIWDTFAPPGSYSTSEKTQLTNV